MHNKRLLDARANRYFFIHSPKEIKIEDSPQQEIKLKLHPDDEKKGYRNFKVKDKFFIEEEDFKKLKDKKIHRLMDCLNFKKKKSKIVFDSLEYEKFKKNPGVIIHWIPNEKNLPKVEIMMPDKKIIKGVADVES